jgi:hypothetical protein
LENGSGSGVCFHGFLSGSLKPGKPQSGFPGPEGQVVNR